MKKSLLTLLLAGVTCQVFAQDFTFTIRRPEAREPALVPAPSREGALQRAARSGNPLQMLNPLAPREYGSGGDFVSYPEREPFAPSAHGEPRALGVRLVAVEIW